MTIRVALVHDIVSPYRAPLFGALASHRDIDLTVVLSGKGEPRRQWTVDLDNLPYPWVMVPSRKVVTGRSAEKSIWFIPSKIGATLNSLSPDVILVNGYSGVPSLLASIWARRRRRPVVMWSESTHGHRDGLVRHIKRAAVLNSTAYVVPGRLASMYMVSLGAKPSQIFVGPNCIDLERFRPPTSPSRLPRTLLFCGRLVPNKGWHLAVEALANVDARRQCRLLVVGDGAGRHALEQQVADCGIEAEFTGHVEYDMLPDIFCGADAVVFPTTDDVWGFSLQEAMACGLPAVSSSRAGATWELVEDGVSGWVVEPEPSSIAAGLAKLMSSTPGQWSSMRRAARQSAERLSVDEAVTGFVGAIRSAVQVQESR